MEHSARTPRASERGIGLVEVMVVLLLIAILSAVAFMSIGGARKTGGRTEVVAAATRYSDAVERFQQEHNRRLPQVGTPTWPTAVEGPVFSLEMGSSTNVRPYLAGGRAPEVMSKGPEVGATIVQAAGGSCSPSGTGGTLVYRPGPAAAGSCGPALSSAHQFSIAVFWMGELICSVGDVPAANRC